MPRCSSSHARRARRSSSRSLPWIWQRVDPSGKQCRAQGSSSGVSVAARAHALRHVLDGIDLRLSVDRNAQPVNACFETTANLLWIKLDVVNSRWAMVVKDRSDQTSVDEAAQLYDELARFLFDRDWNG